MQTEDRIRRFDVVFRTLLIVGTVLFSFNVAFQKERILTALFAWCVFLFSVAVVGWCFGTLYSEIETASKLFAWASLVILILSSYLMFFFQDIPVAHYSIVVTIGYAMSLWLFRYLSPDDRYSRVVLLIMAIPWLFIVLFPFLAEPLLFILMLSGLSRDLLSYIVIVLISLLASSITGMSFIVLEKFKSLSSRQSAEKTSKVKTEEKVT